ncbi:MAG: preprotein translocase subunit SecG [Verrucomicrobiota bacterium]|nr:preprotein translocase subunit SecG [Verrucomicrobiota bacterium]
MNILINVLLGIYVLVALLMVLVILMQRPKSEGLGAAFGGGMTENLFGAQTTNVLTKFTGWLAGTFFLLTFLLSILYAHKGNAQSSLRGALMKGQPVAPAAAAGVPSASPGPSSAVGAPGTITNLTPATNGANAAPASSIKPSDLAVGAVPAGPAGAAPMAPMPASSVQPSASASPSAVGSPPPKP